MRERLTNGIKNLAANRITPAYAGKTANPTTLLLVPWDHPRVCGKDS